MCIIKNLLSCVSTDDKTSNILFLPFRKTHVIALSAAIKQYISTKYDQHPDMFRQDLEVIDNLRRDAVNVKEPHVSGLKKIAAYAAQLAWIGGKFPIDVRDNVGTCRTQPDEVTHYIIDWCRLHVVPRIGIQYGTADITKQPQVRISKCSL